MGESTGDIEVGPATRDSSWLSRARVDAPFFLIAALVVILDQVTKQIIRSNLALGESWPDPDWFVRIKHVTNSGAAFGILQGQAPFLIVTTVIGVVAILLYYLYPPMVHGVLRVVLGLQLGGALGNFIDRLRLGEVTDFIDFRFWPTFNVADSCITIGVIGIIAFFLLYEGSRLRREDL